MNGLGVFTLYDPVAVDKACIDMMHQAPGLSNSAAEESGAMAPGDKKLDMIKGQSVEPQIQGSVSNCLGQADYEFKKVQLDRSQKTLEKYYPNILAIKLKTMYARNHPLE